MQQLYSPTLATCHMYSHTAKKIIQTLHLESVQFKIIFQNADHKIIIENLANVYRVHGTVRQT